MQHDCTSAESIRRITVSISSYMLVSVVHLGITHSNSTHMTWNTIQTDDNPKYFNSFKSICVHFQSFPAHGTIFLLRLWVHSLYKRYKMKAQPRGRIVPSIRVSFPLLAWVFSKYVCFKLHNRYFISTHVHLAPRLKKEYSYTSTPLWAFIACSRANFTFYLILYQVWIFPKMDHHLKNGT